VKKGEEQTIDLNNKMPIPGYVAMYKSGVKLPVVKTLAAPT